MLKPRWILVAAVLLSLAVVLFVSGERIWIRISSVPLYIWKSDHVVEARASRWDRNRFGYRRGWFIESGTLSFENLGRGGPEESIRLTYFEPDGRITSQRTVNARGRSTSHEGPPWNWGARDQSEATAPWVLEGLTCDEWYRQLPESQK